MRIIAGEHKGRRLHAPRGATTRPTPERVREALFSILGDRVEGAGVLDLYAGSGALGIEALSRGAVRATFVDDDPRAIEAITRNLSEIGLEGDVRRRDAVAFLDRATMRFDIVFADPPYSSAPELARTLTERIPRVLADHAVIVTESDKRAPLELDLPLVTERDYGHTRIRIHRGA